MKEGSNMTKNTKIVYVYLALFAFTLGFSFTTSVHAQQDPVQCCVVYWCDVEQHQPELQGHVDRWGQCVYDGTGNRCDIYTICSYREPGSN